MEADSTLRLSAGGRSTEPCYPDGIGFATASGHGSRYRDTRYRGRSWDQRLRRLLHRCFLAPRCASGHGRLEAGRQNGRHTLCGFGLRKPDNPAASSMTLICYGARTTRTSAALDTNTGRHLVVYKEPAVDMVSQL